ncbi:MAG: hypothetical protein SGARI_006920, partial [Bacillariaceae sp.]
MMMRPLASTSSSLVPCRCWNSTISSSDTNRDDDNKPDLSHLASPTGPSKWKSLHAVLNGKLADTEYLQQIQKDHGDVVKLWALQDLNYIFDPDMFMSILRQEWALPYGAAPNTWPFQIYYKAKSEAVMPMMLLQGEAWKQPRHTLQTHMFSPKAADDYQAGINAVVRDGSNYLKQHSHMSGDEANQFLMNVSFEMLAQVLLDRRMGL